MVIMNSHASNSEKLVDMHCHVGLVGDEHPHWGKMSEWYRHQAVYRIFLIYGRIKADQVSDRTLRDATERAIDDSEVDHVVGLALDPVYDQNGQRREDLSHMWVDSDYILDLRQSLGDKVLLGASVHPYDPDFKNRVRKYVDQGAVLLKWLPSAQQTNLADERVRDALTFLATAKDGAPLPLLLHIGPEYAILPSDPRASSYDFLTWTWWDRFSNIFRGSEKWYRPDTKKIEENLRAGLGEGTVIIFAHCGLPYYAPNWLKRILEHSEFKTVRRYLQDYPADSLEGGRCYADVSACVTPFRRSYFDVIKELPAQSLLFGSDFPTPVFELSADVGEMMADLRAVLKGQWDRIVVPQDNLIDVNYRELQHFFPDHPMFTNFNALL
jgi:predicted TIM-barrel fold metal-dependent hydrolase